MSEAEKTSYFTKALQTYAMVKQLHGLISERRFIELTGGYTMAEFNQVDQATAEEVEAHLVQVADYFSHFSNVIIAAFEDNQVEPAVQPKVVSKMIMPGLLDRISRDLSSGKIKTT